MKKSSIGIDKVRRALRKVSRRPITDGNTLLRGVADIQKAFEAALTDEDRALLAERRNAQDSGSTLVYSADDKGEALEDFAFTTAAESLEVMAGQVRIIADQKREALYRKVLDLYYALEDASQDPEDPQHAEILEHLENLRRAHEAQYGKPIPMRH